MPKYFPEHRLVAPISIGIHGLPCHGKHGVHEDEKIVEQRFSVDGTFHVDGAGCLQSDRIEDALNYSTLANFIRDFVKNSSFNLLETLADRLAKDIWRNFPALERLSLTVTKFPNAWHEMGTAFSASVKMEPSFAILGLGSNLGDREANLARAVDAIERIPLTDLIRASAIHETAPLIVTDQDDFLNQSLLIRTILSPVELLSETQKIEDDLGRVRQREKGPRPIDIDLLLFGDRTIDLPALQIPHAALRCRRFWIEELAELSVSIAPEDPSVLRQRCQVFFPTGRQKISDPARPDPKTFRQ